MTVAARIAALGHGGQVLLSKIPTRALTADDLPAGVAVRSLGSHRLRDLDRPRVTPWLVIERPRRTSRRLLRRTPGQQDFPNRLTDFVGRDRELENLNA